MRLHKKNKLILKALDERNVDVLEDGGEPSSDENPYDELVDVTFSRDYKDRFSEVIDKFRHGKIGVYTSIISDLEKDTRRIEKEIAKLIPLLTEKKGSMFRNNFKMRQLKSILDFNKHHKILLFTEYRDTLNAIRSYLGDSYDESTIRFVNSDTKNKTRIIEDFNNTESKLRILISTETLSEGFNISGADIVINFDIPYNPVRLIQRIGRATRLDVPKLVQVKNFRPSEEIDREIDLVDRLQLRIEDIIRFVGLDYRIWFERETPLLSVRRSFDSEIYKKISMEILKGVRSDYWKGRFDKLEVTIQYSNPVVALMQRAIKLYGINKEEVLSSKLVANSYTILKAKKSLSVFYGSSESYNTAPLTGLEISQSDKVVLLEDNYSEELANFKHYLEAEKQRVAMLSYYNDRTDKMVRTIIDKLASRHYLELYPSANELREELLRAKDNAGDRTARIVREIHTAMKGEIGNDQIVEYTRRLTTSFRVTLVQKALQIEDAPYLALALIEG